MMFRMEGRKARLVRFVVKYEMPAPGKRNGPPVLREERCISASHKDAVEAALTARGISFTTEAIDQTGNEWFDGLEFRSYDEAAEVLSAGEKAYVEAQKQTTEARLNTHEAAIEAIIIDALTGGD